MNNAKKIRSAVAVFLAFIMSLCIVVSLAIGALKLTAFNPSYSKKVFVSCGFSDKKIPELKTELVSYGNACNIGGDFFDDFFTSTLTSQFVEEDAADYYTRLISDKNVKIDSSRLEQLLKPALKEYAEKMGYADVDSLDEDIDLIVSEMGAIYAGVISVPSASTINSVAQRINRLCNMGIIAVAFGIVLTGFMLIFMFKPKVYSVRYLIYAFSGAVPMLVALPLYLRMANIIGRVNIVSKALYSFVVSFGNGVLDCIVLSACVCIVIVVCFSLIYLKLTREEE